jgi:hypothetical protein
MGRKRYDEEGGGGGGEGDGMGWLRYKTEVSTCDEWEGRANDGSECTRSKTWVVIEIGVWV